MAYRIDTDGSVAGAFADPVPDVSQGTLLDAAYMNEIQEEVYGFIESRSITLVKGVRTQLTSAIADVITALKAAANTWALLQTFSKGLAVTQSTAATPGVTSTGGTTGSGGTFTGGSTSGTGVIGTGGASNGVGGAFTGDGTGVGVSGTGGDNSGSGLYGVGGATNGDGCEAHGTGSGSGVFGYGGTSAGVGVDGQGGTNGYGVQGTGNGSGAGVAAVGGATAPGLVAVKGASTADGIESTGYIYLSGSDPAGTDSIVDRITPLSVAKVLGRVVTDGVGGVTISGALNVASVSLPGSNKVRVTIAGDFANTDYICQLTSELAGAAAYPSTRATGTFDFEVWAEDAGGILTVVNPASIATIVHVTLFGAQ